MSISFENQVAILTGAGLGLGRSHAMQFAARGARVVVNDLGPDGQPSESSLAVVAEIEAAGGEAMAHGANVAFVCEIVVGRCTVVALHESLRFSTKNLPHITAADLHVVAHISPLERLRQIARSDACCIFIILHG